MLGVGGKAHYLSPSPETPHSYRDADCHWLLRTAWIRASNSSYVRTFGNRGNSAATFAEGRNRMPASYSPSMVVSLYESPTAITKKFNPRKARTAYRLPSTWRIW